MLLYGVPVAMIVVDKLVLCVDNIFYAVASDGTAGTAGAAGAIIGSFKNLCEVVLISSENSIKERL